MTRYVCVLCGKEGHRSNKCPNGAHCGAPKWAKWIPIADAVQPVAPKEAKDWIGS